MSDHPSTATPQSPYEDVGPWRVELDQHRVRLYSDDFTHDVTLTIDGDFADDDQRVEYAASIVRRLSALSETAVTVEDVDRALSEAANSCRHDEQYYLHGLWKAHEIIRALKSGPTGHGRKSEPLGGAMPPTMPPFESPTDLEAYLRSITSWKEPDEDLRHAAAMAAQQSGEPVAAPSEPCATCNGDPEVCATVPGLRHYEAANREGAAPHAPVVEYDGAFKCLTCGASWGLLPGNPKMPESCGSRHSAQTEWRKCSLHPDVNPETMWGCPDCLAELRHQLAQSAGAVASEPIAYAWRSLKDGSYSQKIVPVKYVMFDTLMETLRNDPWVKNGVAEIVPLYAAPFAPSSEAGNFDEWMDARYPTWGEHGWSKGSKSGPYHLADVNDAYHAGMKLGYSLRSASGLTVERCSAIAQELIALYQGQGEYARAGTVATFMERIEQANRTDRGSRP